MKARKTQLSRHRYLDETFSGIFSDEVGKALWKFIPANAGNDPTAVLIFGGIGVVTLLLSSPLWAPFLGIYALVTKNLNAHENQQRKMEWDKEEDDQLKADVVARDARLQSMPRAPRLSFSAITDLAKDSDLDKLPKDLSGVIGGFLDHESLSRLIQGSKSTHVLFNQSWKASALLNFAKKSNYDKADELLNIAKPQLMFKREALAHSDGSVEYLSPLELSIKQVDLQMWNLFKKKIENAGNEDILANFNKMSIAFEGKYINLQPLFDAYESFQKLYAAWLNGDNITVERLSESLLQIAVMQRELLPQHVLNDFSNNNFKWKIDDDVSSAEKLGEVSSYRFALSSNIGVNDICVRGNHEYSGMTLANVAVKGLCFDKNNPQSIDVNRERLEKLASALQYDAVVLNHVIARKVARLSEEIGLINQMNIVSDYYRSTASSLK